MKKLNQKSQLLIVFLAVGFFMGIIYENLISRTQGMSISFFQRFYLKQYAQMEMIMEEYLWYVAQMRVFSLIILCILGCLKWKKILVIVWLSWTGFLGGILMVSAVIQLGIEGLFLCMAGIFPQIICYGLVYGILLLHLYYYPERKWNASKMIFLIITLFMGIILETYISPLLVKWIISFM